MHGAERFAAEMKAMLAADERVLGEGRVDEAGAEGVGSYGYIVVTPRRIVIAPSLDRDRVFSSPFAALRSYSEALAGHRWYLHLRHEPITRTRYGRTLPFNIARHRRRRVRERETFLRFSRRDTGAALAIRSQLGSIERREWDAPSPEIRGRQRLISRAWLVRRDHD
jgi:hypothetical protein